MRPPLFLAMAVLACAKSALCQEAKCPEPKNMYVHYRVQGGEEFQEEFPVGTTLTYRCGPGYIPREIKTWNATCYQNYDGSVDWNIGKHDCRPVSCGYPGDVRYGRLLDAVFVFPRRVRYQCNRGYRLEGREELYCQSDAQWSAPKPECRIVECGPLESIGNGTVRLSGTVFGSKAEFSCNHGFKLVGNSARTCGADGQWSDESPHCEEVWCSEEMLLEFAQRNGTVVVGDQPISGRQRSNTRVTHICPPNTDLVGSEINTCQENGAWLFDPPACKAKCIVQPGPGSQVQRRTSGWRTRFSVVESGTQVSEFEHNLFVECVNGYVLRSRRMEVELPLSCKDGVWTPSGPWCIEKPCTIHGPFPEGVEAEQYGEVPHGQEVRFRCMSGYMMQNTENEQHQPRCLFGRIDGSYPSCKPDDCRIEDLPFVENGRLRAGQSVSHGSLAIYECNPSLELQQRGGGVRCHFGQWIGTSPLCVPKKCIAPELTGTILQRKKSIAKGGDMRERSLTYWTTEVLPGAEVTDGDQNLFVKCRQGYHLLNTREPETQVLCKSGAWQPPPPWCAEEDESNRKRKVCKLENKHSRFKAYHKGIPVTPEGPFEHGTELVFHCEPVGEVRFEGPRTARCIDGKWDPQVPLCYPLKPSDIAVRFLNAIYTAPRGIVYVDPNSYVVVDCWSNSSVELSLKSDDQSNVISSTRIRQNFMRMKFWLALGKSASVICRRQVTPDNPRSIIVRGQPQFWCPPLSSNSQGLRMKRRTERSYYFTCMEGYQIVGEPDLHCQKHGWSDPIPKCEPISGASNINGASHQTEQTVAQTAHPAGPSGATLSTPERTDSQSTERAPAETPHSTAKVAADPSPPHVVNENEAPKTEGEHGNRATDSPVLNPRYSTQEQIGTQSGVSKDLNAGSNNGSTMEPKPIPGQRARAPPQDVNQTSHSKRMNSQTCRQNTTSDSCTDLGNRNGPPVESCEGCDEEPPIAESITANNASATRKRDKESTRDASGSRATDHEHSTGGPWQDANTTAPPAQVPGKLSNRQEPHEEQYLSTSTTTTVKPTMSSSTEATMPLSSNEKYCLGKKFFEIAPPGLVIALNETQVPENSTFWAFCDDGFTLVGNVTAVSCLHDGTWSLPPNITCIEACGNFDAGPGGPALEGRKESYDLGDSITLSCKNGTELQPRIERLLCLGDRWSENAVPICVPAKVKTNGAKNEERKRA
ncbi:sushi, von Willebrand factor type A, EGF and pentraxin domain-containing protein 1-like isoform X3 [Amblyomma americanum]